MMRAMTTWVCMTVALAAFGPARAQLNDPTRPPGAVAGGDPALPAGGSLLQSVQISPQGRSAIIGGEVVKLNGKYGEARVIRITENEVVLRTATGTETLRMYPDVSIKPVVEAVPAKARKPAARTPAAKPQGKQE
jgi:MSHA biogenesis protein MshK